MRLWRLQCNALVGRGVESGTAAHRLANRAQGAAGRVAGAWWGPPKDHCMHEQNNTERCQAKGHPRMQQAKPTPAQELVRAARQAGRQPPHGTRAEQAKQVEKQHDERCQAKGHPRMQQAKPTPAQELVRAARQAGRQPPHGTRAEQAKQVEKQHDERCQDKGPPKNATGQARPGTRAGRSGQTGRQAAAT